MSDDTLPTMHLPIEAALPDLLAALKDRPNAVLVAPPGAGKTTCVPLALLAAPWRGGGRILLLEPRRLAARAAARRMADTLGEPVGETVGLRVRFETRIGPGTRIEVVTEGVLTRLIQADPSLEGVACVIFDEFHERSLDADLGLALARDAQTGLRDDLRLLVMSATLDAAPVAALLDDAPVIESAGRAFPVDTRYVGRGDPQGGPRGTERHVVANVERALREEAGSLLVFLPGTAEIRRVAERLAAAVADDTVIAPLYGALTPREQDAAIRPAPAGKRKVVLATSIAETSLTIDGVRIVVDSGLMRVPVFEPDVGLSRLETVRVSRAAADQRRGRAGRTEPGVCYRLWDEGQTRGLLPFTPPEILSADLAPLILNLAAWGVGEPERLAWLDPPPVGAVTQARALLRSLGAIDAAGRVTGHGSAMTRLPLHPRLAHMVLAAGVQGSARLAAEIAMVLSEPTVGGRDVDLRERVRRLRRDLADRRTISSGGRLSAVAAAIGQWVDVAHSITGSRGTSQVSAEMAGPVLALAFPDRIAQAQARGAHDGRFRLANGRRATVDATEALASEPFLAIAEIAGSRERARILLAAPIDLATIEVEFADRIEDADDVTWDDATGRVMARRVRRLGALLLGAAPLRDPPADRVARALCEALIARGFDRLDWSARATSLRARARFLRQVDEAENNGAPLWPDVSDAALAATADTWLEPHLVGLKRPDEVTGAVLDAALASLLPWPVEQQIEQLAPRYFTAPTGTRVPIEYRDDGSAVIAVRVQEMFGVSAHPTVGRRRIPLTIELLSPARRPVQVTQDLPGFWCGSYAAVKAEMKGRYPKHPWPDDPLAADATRRAKPRGT